MATAGGASTPAISIERTKAPEAPRALLLIPSPSPPLEASVPLGSYRSIERPTIDASVRRASAPATRSRAASYIESESPAAVRFLYSTPGAALALSVLRWATDRGNGPKHRGEPAHGLRVALAEVFRPGRKIATEQERRHDGAEHS